MSPIGMPSSVSRALRRPIACWGTEEVMSVRVRSKADFEISLRFAWQEAEDPHVVTFYIEDGECLTHSVDG